MPRDDVDRLIRLVRGGESCVTIVTHEEGEALEVVRQAAMGLGRGVWLWSSAGGVRDGLVEGGRGVGAGVSVGRDGGVGGGGWGGGGGGGDEMALRAAAGLLLLGEASRCHEGAVCVALDAGDHIDDPMALRSLRETVMGASRLGGCVVLIDHRDRYPESVAAHSTRFEIALPNEEELERVVRSTLRSMHRDREVVIDLKRSEYSAILRNLLGLTRRQASRVVAEAVSDDRRLSIEDLTTIMAHKRRAVEAAGLLEFVESPMSLDEIGGLEKLKSWLRDRESTMGLGVGFSGRGLSDSGDAVSGSGGGVVGGVGGVLAARYRLSAPRGVLLLGVQGAGKSLCAKAIATAWRRPLLRLDVGSLYDKFIGESEKRLRGALGQAEAMSPVVLWIDEIEKAFAGAASQSSDGGLSRRMFGALLTWMQEHSSPVFLVATANDIEALPAELLRKGRFDEIFFVDLPGEGARRRIFEIHLGRRGLDPGLFELDALVRASEGYSGAEIEQGVLAALHRGVSSAVREGRVGRVGGGKGEVISTADVVECLRSSPPLSVTMAEAVGALRAWARDRTVPAG